MFKATVPKLYTTEHLQLAVTSQTQPLVQNAATILTEMFSCQCRHKSPHHRSSPLGRHSDMCCPRGPPRIFLGCTRPCHTASADSHSAGQRSRRGKSTGSCSPGPCSCRHGDTDSRHSRLRNSVISNKVGLFVLVRDALLLPLPD